MSKRLTGLLAFLLLILAVWISFNFDQSNYHSGESMTATAFSTDRALKHIEKLEASPIM